VKSTIEEKEDDDISICSSVETINSTQIQDGENELSSNTYHPVLIDITNTISPTLLKNEATITGHEILREAARRDLQIYTNQMVNQMNLGRKRPNQYEIGDLVRIMIPKIDRSGIDRPTLPCKIIKKTESNQYVLGSKFGIINTCYSPGEFEPLGVQCFPELNNLPSNKISVREAAHLQNTGSNTSVICNCKHNCNNNKCSCKKKGSNCGSRCHGGRPCNNKCDN